MLLKASAPGNLMLLGEYAVLHGKQALACAIDKRITVTLAPRADKKIHLRSALGEHITNVTTLTVTPPFQFVLAVLKNFATELPSGCDVEIHSEFSSQMGFGSSAAVAAATFSAVSCWLGKSFTLDEQVSKVAAIVRLVQNGLGSGADVAACTLGGMVAYKMHPLSIEKIVCELPLTAIYSGYKTPTQLAIQQVTESFASNQKLFYQLCDAIHECAVHGVVSARGGDWAALGKIMNVQQGLMESLGVNTLLLSELIAMLRLGPQILGAKISGAGLGDCVVGLGSLSGLTFKDEKIKLVPLTISSRGVTCEKI
jgi:mevalonate kinase